MLTAVEPRACREESFARCRREQGQLEVPIPARGFLKDHKRPQPALWPVAEIRGSDPERLFLVALSHSEAMNTIKQDTSTRAIKCI